MNKKLNIIIIIFGLCSVSCQHKKVMSEQIYSTQYLVSNVKYLHSKYTCIHGSLSFDRTRPILFDQNYKSSVGIYPLDANLQKFVDLSQEPDLVLIPQESVVVCGKIKIDDECYFGKINCIPSKSIYITNAKIEIKR
jgi:predicted small secreted protein